MLCTLRKTCRCQLCTTSFPRGPGNAETRAKRHLCAARTRTASSREGVCDLPATRSRIRGDRGENAEREACAPPDVRTEAATPGRRPLHKCTPGHNRGCEPRMETTAHAQSRSRPRLRAPRWSSLRTRGVPPAFRGAKRWVACPSLSALAPV